LYNKKKRTTFAQIKQNCAGYTPMTISKTRVKLVDVARQLFAKMGVENTTMNDIAIASKKGRRTLYTYFKSKDEIYSAVVESELDMLSDIMKKVAEKNTSPDEKLLELIYTRLDAVKEVVYRNGTLRANFFRDIWRVEKVRKKFDAREIILFKTVMAEGKEKGVFRIDDIEMAANIIHYSIKGIEVPYIRGTLGRGLDPETRKKYVMNIVFGALYRKEINQ
jgi:AcrR family transcriptional regulator